MFNGELKAREARLLAEQKARVDKERSKLQKEKDLAERSRQREATREEERRQAHVEQLAKEQAVRACFHSLNFLV